MATATKSRTTRTKAERRAARAVSEGTADFTATHQKDAVEAAAAAPAAQWVHRKVGPLTVRVHPDDTELVPTVESLAAHAATVLGAKVSGYDPSGYRASEGTPERLRGFTNARATREAAAFSVKHLRNTKGEPFTKSELSPLVSLVRKQLVADVRGRHQARVKADAENARLVAARERESGKIRDRAIAKAERALKVAVLPVASRPSKAVSKDQTRPILTRAHITKVDDSWQLVCTDSYQATIFPLEVHGDAGLVDCTIDTDAIKAIESAGAFRIDTKSKQVVPMRMSSTARSVNNPKGGTVQWPEPTAVVDGTTRYAIVTTDQFPKMRDDGKKGRGNTAGTLYLQAPPTPSKRMEMTFNARLLSQLADALDADAKGKGTVTIVFDLDAFNKAEDGSRQWAITGKERNGVRVSPSIRIERTDGKARAHLMPVRPTK